MQVSVEVIKRADILHKLEQQEINFGIMSGQIEQPDLAYEDFMQDDLVLIIPAKHPLADQEVISPDKLRGQTIILRSVGACSGGWKPHQQQQNPPSWVGLQSAKAGLADVGATCSRLSRNYLNGYVWSALA